MQLAQAADIDLSSAEIFAPAGLIGPEMKTTNLFVDEIAARTRRRFKIVRDWPDDDAAVPVIAIGPAGGAEGSFRDSGEDGISQVAPRRGLQH